MSGVLRATAWATGALVLIPYSAWGQNPQQAQADSLHQAPVYRMKKDYENSGPKDDIQKRLEHPPAQVQGDRSDH